MDIALFTIGYIAGAISAVYLHDWRSARRDRKRGYY